MMNQDAERVLRHPTVTVLVCRYAVRRCVSLHILPADGIYENLPCSSLGIEARSRTPDASLPIACHHPPSLCACRSWERIHFPGTRLNPVELPFRAEPNHAVVI